MEQIMHELEAALVKQVGRNDEQSLEVGPTHWWIGRPMASDPDHIMLGQGEGFALTVRRKDVLDIRKVGVHFAVELGEDANMIATLRRVIKAKPTGCDCLGRPSSGGVAEQQADSSIWDTDSDVLVRGSIDDGNCQVNFKKVVISGIKFWFVEEIICNL